MAVKIKKTSDGKTASKTPGKGKNIFYVPNPVTRAEREKRNRHKSCIIWLTGLSGAGKSTMIKLMREHIQILCDEINIIRKWPDGSYKVHGTWNHGELPELSAGEAPLIGLFFLKQAKENKICQPYGNKRRQNSAIAQ